MVKLLDVNKDWRQTRPDLTRVEGGWLFTGYQSYIFTKDNITPLNQPLQVKDSIVRPYLKTLIDADMTVLDLGCANMYFGLLAQTLGAKSILGVDIDKRYLAKLHTLFYEAKLQNVEVIDMNVVEVQGSYDVVIALAIVHWIYSCTALVGSLDKVIKFLGRLTERALFVEWVNEDDSAIQSFGHIKYNKDLAEDDYNRETFINTASEIFKEVKSIGFSKLNREIFLCIK